MGDRMGEFLEKLERLCCEYGAVVGYTTDDDGVHVEVDGEDVSIGFSSRCDPGGSIRAAVLERRAEGRACDD